MSERASLRVVATQHETEAQSERLALLWRLMYPAHLHPAKEPPPLVISGTGEAPAGSSHRGGRPYNRYP
jgi:hypothetical protein